MAEPKPWLNESFVPNVDLSGEDVLLYEDGYTSGLEGEEAPDDQVPEVQRVGWSNGSMARDKD